MGGVKHEYTLDGTKILRETWGNNVLIPLYDNEDSVCGILYNSALYYFLKNLQGDIIAIVDKDGEKVAEYVYDAWGDHKIYDANGTKVTSTTHIGYINPYRYRSYYYDAEIAKYYLQSRYYDAVVGRFVNGDEVETIGLEITVLRCNLFSYCSNCPVNDDDDGGELSFNSIKNIISNLINSVFEAALKELTNLFKITRNSFEVKNSVIAAAIDFVVMCVSAVAAFLAKSAIKLVVRKFLLKRIGASNKFITFLIDLLLKPGIIGIVVASISFVLRWEEYKTKAFTSDVIQNLLGAKSKLLGNIYTIYNAISSVGSFIAFCLDLFDGNPNGYFKIRFA